MDASTLYQFINRLQAGQDPISAAPLSADSIVHQPAIAEALAQLASRLAALAAERPPQPVSQPALGPSAAAVTDLKAQLTRLGLKVTATQLARVYRGSRSVIHPALRLLAVFGKYRGLLTEKELVQYLNNLLKDSPSSELPLEDDPLLSETVELSAPSKAEATPLAAIKAGELATAPAGSLQEMQLGASMASKATEAWQQEPFFTEAAYDQLEETHLADWKSQVEALGLRRSTERLPSYLQGARTNFPRSFEPWCGEERAILLEALCYTNRVDRLVAVFGRSAAALEREGKKLIYKSRQKSA